MIKPKQMGAAYDIELSDGKRSWGLILDGKNAIQETSLSEEQFAAYFRSTNKKFGDFDEQRSWKGGRGVEFLSDNPDGYWDSLNAWTLSSGHLTPSLQWKFSKDIRSADFSCPGSLTWKALVGDNRYLSVSFTSAGYTTAWGYAWIRRVGKPGTLTYAIYSTSGGVPNAALVTGTLTTSDVTDVVSVFQSVALAYAMSGATYHFVIYGASTDTAASHWEVGCNNGASGAISSAGSSWTSSTYAPYYRITDSESLGIWRFFEIDGAMYCVWSPRATGTASTLYLNGERGLATAGGATSLTDSNSGMRSTWTTDMWDGAFVKIVRGTGIGQVREITSNTSTALTVTPSWDVNPSTDSEYIIYSTDRFVELTSTGLGNVKGQPVVVGGIAYFPQGSTTIRRMRWNSSAHEYADDGSNTADFLCVGFEANKTVVWRALNSTSAIARSDSKTWGTALVFGTAIPVGESGYTFTNLDVHEGKLYVFKENSVWSIYNDIPVEESFGIRESPSVTNGVASATHNRFLYFSWLWSVERMFGGSIDDIGMDWSKEGLPDGREGFISKLQPVVGWLFAAVNAGRFSGTSSVLAWDGYAWHEIFRAFKSGRRIQNIHWQPCEETRGRLWISHEEDLMFIEFPKNKASPLLDSGVNYMHEGVVESATIDMGAASRLPKFIKALTITTKNLPSEITSRTNTGIKVYMDYQYDSLIGGTTWIYGGVCNTSPESEINVTKGNVRQFRYRLRLHTNDSTIPPDVRGVVPNGFARVPWRLVWHIRIKAGEIFAKGGKKNADPNELREWLHAYSRYPSRIKMYSIYPQLHNKYVIIAPPSLSPVSAERPQLPGKSIMNISIMEA